MNKVLTSKFFDRPVLRVSSELLGKTLCRCIDGKKTVYIITEVEAYDGEDDLANHASSGKTKRTEVMYGPSGVWYIYLCYGMYWMLNIVTGPISYPSAVLIRGTQEISGPGCLTRALHIDKKLNKKIAQKDSGLWIEDRGIFVPKSKIEKKERIGVNYAGKIWSKKQYRFLYNIN